MRLTKEDVLELLDWALSHKVEGLKFTPRQEELYDKLLAKLPKDKQKEFEPYWR